MFKQAWKILLGVNSPKSCNLHTKPNFTKKIYDVIRGNYNSVEEEHLHFFRNLLGESRSLTDLSDIEKYNVNWQKSLRGNSQIVLKPKNTHEVSQILSYCNYNRLAVCPQGGNTSISGGATPIFDEIVISSELLNQIVSLDEKSGVLVCESGCILQKLDDLLAAKNLTLPLDLGSKGSCHIGGNVSTNAGGIRVLRYGNLHGNILGLEVVQANGTVLDMMSSCKKDNTGYHLKHLFIGSEGTLGFVTKVVIQCRTRPKSTHVAFLGVQSFDKVVKTFYTCKQELDEILGAFEVMDSLTMDVVREKLGLESPIGDYPFYVLIETTGSDEGHDRNKLDKFLDGCIMKHFILNGTVTGEPGKMQAIWKIRERIPETYKNDGFVFMYDLSVPLDYYYELVEEMRKHMGNLSHRVYGFGHIGDCNVHLNICVEKYTPELQQHIEPYIYELTKSYKGSISAEHGLGFLKAKYLNLVKSQESIDTMKNIKQIMDPKGILNPYKILMEESC